MKIISVLLQVEEGSSGSSSGAGWAEVQDLIKKCHSKSGGQEDWGETLHWLYEHSGLSSRCSDSEVVSAKMFKCTNCDKIWQKEERSVNLIDLTLEVGASELDFGRIVHIWSTHQDLVEFKCCQEGNLYVPTNIHVIQTSERMGFLLNRNTFKQRNCVPLNLDQQFSIVDFAGSQHAYQVQMVGFHKGALNGHFTGAMMNPLDGQWYIFDGDRVKLSSWDALMASKENIIYVAGSKTFQPAQLAQARVPQPSVHKKMESLQVIPSTMVSLPENPLGQAQNVSALQTRVGNDNTDHENLKPKGTLPTIQEAREAEEEECWGFEESEEFEGKLFQPAQASEPQLPKPSVHKEMKGLPKISSTLPASGSSADGSASLKNTSGQFGAATQGGSTELPSTGSASSEVGSDNLSTSLPTMPLGHAQNDPALLTPVGENDTAPKLIFPEEIDLLLVGGLDSVGKEFFSAFTAHGSIANSRFACFLLARKINQFLLYDKKSIAVHFATAWWADNAQRFKILSRLSSDDERMAKFGVQPSHSCILSQSRCIPVLKMGSFSWSPDIKTLKIMMLHQDTAL
jgi:hypothetical protein